MSGGQLSYLALGFATIDPSVITWGVNCRGGGGSIVGGLIVGGSIVGGSIVGGSIVAVPFITCTIRLPVCRSRTRTIAGPVH